MLKPKPPEFWVSNISDRDISLCDLRLTIRARRNVNLLDARHYHYTLAQLQKSAASGSLYAKGKNLKVRPGQPQVVVSRGPELSQAPQLLKPLRSQIKIEIPQFDELVVADTAAEDALAAETADIAFAERAPVLAVDKKYKKPAE